MTAISIGVSGQIHVTSGNMVPIVSAGRHLAWQVGQLVVDPSTNNRGSTDSIRSRMTAQA